MGLSKQTSRVIVLFFLVFAVHLLYVLAVQLPKRKVRTTGKKAEPHGIHHIALFDDEDAYVNLAYHLSQQGIFSLDGKKPTAQRVPLYPLMLSGVFSFTPNAAYALWINCLLAALAALACYYLGKLYWSERAGLLAMAIVGFSPHTFNWFLWMQAEALTSVLVMWFLLFFSKFVKQGKAPYLVWSGLTAGLAALARPETLLLIPLFTAYLVWQGRWAWGKMLLRPGVFLLSAAIVLSPWILRNSLTMHYPGLSTIGGFTFAGGQNEKTFSDHPGSWYALAGYATPKELAETAGMDEVALDRYLWKRGLNELRHLSLGQFLSLELHKLHRTFKPSFGLWGREFGREWLNLAYAIPYFCLYFFFWLCVLYHYTMEQEQDDITILLLVWVIPAAVTLIFWGAIRFRTPYEPAAFTVAAGYIDKFLKKFDNII